MSLLIIGNRCDLNCATMHSGESFSQLVPACRREAGWITFRSRCGWRPFDPYPVPVPETGCEGGPVAATVPSAHRAGRGSYGAHRPAAFDLPGEVPGTRRVTGSRLAGRRPADGADVGGAGAGLRRGRDPAQATASGQVSARPESVAVSRAGRAGEDGTVESLARLREQRAFRCRLSPGRRWGRSRRRMRSCGTAGC
jgi:hypothetical protein